MQIRDAVVNNNITRYINIGTLLLLICLVFFYPVKKEIWYDESVSMLCSKGLYYTTGNELTALGSNSSAVLEAKNNATDVYKCTLIDNGNSFLYNELLHYYTNLSGNSINSYMWLSKLSAAGMLVLLFVLCGLLWGDSIFTALALVLMCADGISWTMAHEIRAYEMGMMFIVGAAVFTYKYLYKTGNSKDLFFAGLLSVSAVLCHYLSAYAVLVLVAYILLNKKTELLRIKNIAAIAVPVALAGIYLVLAAQGFAVMNRQNSRIAQTHTATNDFSIAHVATLSMKFTNSNFKFVISSFTDSVIVTVLAFVFVIALYVVAVRLSPTKKEKRDLHFLFLSGMSGTLFLSLLCLKSHHYTALYFRYFSFCVPFATLFTVYALYIVYNSPRVKKIAGSAAIALVTLPTMGFFSIILKGGYKLKYNHMNVARMITDKQVDKLIAPNWTDAFLIQSSLPKGYQLNYMIDSTTKDLILIKTDTVNKIPVLRVNS